MSTLRSVTAVVGEPVAPVVALLESLLADARAGKIHAVAVATLSERGHGSHSLAWGERTNLLTLEGAAHRLSHRLLAMTLPPDDEV